jgi:hypothetical protein
MKLVNCGCVFHWKYHLNISLQLPFIGVHFKAIINFQAAQLLAL